MAMQNTTILHSTVQSAVDPYPAQLIYPGSICSCDSKDSWNPYIFTE